MEKLIDIRKEVANTLINSNALVEQIVVRKFVDEEINRRTTVLLSVIAKREEAEKQLQKIKPQPQFFDAEGKPIETSVAFTAQQNGERKKLLEKIKKIDDAYSAAFANTPPNWEPLTKIADNKDGKTEE